MKLSLDFQTAIDCRLSQLEWRRFNRLHYPHAHEKRWPRDTKDDSKLVYIQRSGQPYRSGKKNSRFRKKWPDRDPEHCVKQHSFQHFFLLN